MIYISILFPIFTGTVMSLQKISALQGGFAEAGGLLGNTDYFGSSMALIGDLNGDGVPDLAVGAPWDDLGVPNSNKGAVYVLFTIPTEIPTEVPTEAPTTPPFLYSCTDASSFSVPVQPVNDACYPVIYVFGYDNPENACFYKYDNASMASGATIQVLFSGADNCGSMKMDEKHSLNVFISYVGCRSLNHANDITCELNTLVEESAELQAPDFIHIKDNKQKSYDADIEVLSDLHGVSLTLNDTVLDGAALYLNVTLSVDANSTAVLDFISVVLNPKYERLNGPLTLYSDNAIQDSSAAIIQNHGKEISFKIEAGFFYTAVTLRMLVSFANDTTSRRLFEVQRTL